MALRHFLAKLHPSATGTTIIKDTDPHRGTRYKGILAGTGITVTGGTNDVTVATSGVSAITSGTITGATLSANINSDVKRTSASVTVNASATYVDVTGLLFTVVPGTYRFSLKLPSTVASGTGGIKYAFHYVTTVVSVLESSATGFAAAASATQHTTTATDVADLFSSATVTLFTAVDGTMVVTTGGTVQVQMAQNTSNGSNTIALIGGTGEFTRIA